MGPFDDAVQDIKQNAIEKWDYSGLFPTQNPDGTTYVNPKGPIFLNGYPFQLDRQVENVSNGGQLTQPIVSIYALPTGDEDRTLGDIYQSGVGSGPLSLRLGRRVNPSFLIGCWADQQLGGLDMARKLAGHVFSALFYYRNSLTTVRGLRMIHSQEDFSDAAQIYHVDLTIVGRSLVVTDV